MHFLKQKLMAVTRYIPPARPVPPGAYPSQNKRVQEVTFIPLPSFLWQIWRYEYITLLVSWLGDNQLFFLVVNHRLVAPNSSLFLHQDNAYMLVLKRNLNTVFEQSKMIAVVQNNASSCEDLLVLSHRLYKHGITVKFFPNKVQFLAIFPLKIRAPSILSEFFFLFLMPFIR